MSKHLSLDLVAMQEVEGDPPSVIPVVQVKGMWCIESI